MSSSEYSVFKPKSKRGIFIDYPELRHFEAFKTLENNPMLFVWYFACESSPYAKIIDERKRVELAVKKADYKRGTKVIADHEIEKMKAGTFSTKMTVAIEEMKRFKVGVRIQALMMVQKGFDNLSRIIDVDINDKKIFENEEGEVDFSKYKSYVDTVGKAVELVPKMINQLEGRFGLKEDKVGGTFEGESFMDTFHENQD